MSQDARPKTLKLGVLGGTFDPPHNGHLLIAEAALTQLDLDQVLVAPTRHPPHKISNPLTSIEHRLAMVRLAIANHPRLVLSRVDVDRSGPTYTVDTLRLLREHYGANVEFYFIMGMDSLANLLTWRHPEQLIRLCKLVVFQRSGFHTDLDAFEKRLPGLRPRVIFLPNPTPNIAASDLQRRVRAGESIEHLVPAPVARYIREHGLYK